MNIKSKTVEMEMEGREVYDIAWAIQHSLRAGIKEHWNNLQQKRDGEPLFFEQEAPLLQIMKKMFEVSGYSHCYDSAISEFKKSFADKRKERETQSTPT